MAFGLVLAFIFFVLFFSSATNLFGVAEWDNWDQFQLDSDSFILNRVEADAMGADTSRFGLLMENPPSPFGVYERMKEPGWPATNTPPDVRYQPYESMVGAIGHLVSWFWLETPCSGVRCFRVANSALFALMSTLMFLGFWRLISRSFATAWIVAVAMSPWMIAAARNLYWSPWMWLAPVAATFLLLVSKEWWTRLASLFLVTGAFALKYVLTGFEIFTSITIFAMSIPLLALVLRVERQHAKRRLILDSILVGVASAAAFLFTLSLQAWMLSGNVFSGATKIWNDTILRRTWGNADEQDAIFAGSLEASPIVVIRRYLLPEWWWRTDFLAFSFDRFGSVFTLGLGGTAFFLTLCASLAVAVIRAGRRDRRWWRDGALIVLGFLVAASWFVAAKGHSFIHTHVLFFLWYLLLAPAILFVLVSFARPLFGRLGAAIARVYEPEAQLDAMPQRESEST